MITRVDPKNDLRRAHRHAVRFRRRIIMKKRAMNGSLIGDLLSGNFTFQSGQGGMIFPNWLKRNKNIIVA